MILNQIRDLRGRGGHVAFMILTLAAAASLGLAGCTVKTATPPVVAIDETVSPDAIVVPGNQAWVDTGIDVVAGQPLTIVGKGRVIIGKLHDAPGDVQSEIGP